MSNGKLTGVSLQCWQALKDLNEPITAADLATLMGRKDVSGTVTHLCKAGWAQAVDGYERPRRYIHATPPSVGPDKPKRPPEPIPEGVPDAYVDIAAVVEAAIGKKLTPREVMVVHRTANTWLLKAAS